MRWSKQTVTVEVPATAANLGPGFDSFGLALSLHDRVVLGTAASGVDVEVDGEGADDVPRDENHLVVRAARAAFETLGAGPPGLRLRCRNAVPHGRGLGSSASAIVAGIIAARELAERSEAGAGEPLHETGALHLATKLEGHPDNVAAALLGGFTVAWSDPGGVRAVRLEPAVSVVALVPTAPVATAVARGLLPEQVPHGDAAANSARSGLLVAAMTTRPGLLLPATEDRLHQDYREEAMPASMQLVRRLRGTGHAAVMSGAGPTVLVLCDQTVAGSPPDAELVDALAAVAPDWKAWPLGVDVQGVRVVS